MKRALPALALAVVLSSSLVPMPAGASSGPMRMELRLQGVAAPRAQKTGDDVPVYLAYATQTSFVGGREIEYLREEMRSNAVAISRAALGGHAADDWQIGSGLRYGPGPVHPTQARLADDLHIWGGLPAGVAAASGEDLAHLHTWFGNPQPWLQDPEPTALPGVLGWDHREGWANSIAGSTTEYPRIAFSEGTAARSPVASNYRTSMLVDHAFLEARGGDVSAQAGALSAPAVTLGSENPVGKDMAFQMVQWTSAGTYGEVTVLPDWTAGRATAMTGEWRLPVAVTLPAGARMPERRDLAHAPTPQYTLPVTAVGIPMPENQPPGEQVITFETHLQPGERIQGAMAVRQADGSLRTFPVLIDEPGPRTWRVEEGNLVPEQVLRGAYAPAGEDPSEVAGEAPAQEPVGASPADEAPRIDVNDAGRPVARNVRYGATALLDSFDIANLVTDGGTTELGEHNRIGRVVIVDGDAERNERIARAAYAADGVLVMVELRTFDDTLGVWFETAPLDGSQRPHTVESVADVADGVSMRDPLTGPIDRATTFLGGEVAPAGGVALNGPRLVFDMEDPVPAAVVDGGSLSEVEVRNRSAPAGGEQLVDPIIVSRTDGPTPLGRLTYPFLLMPAPDAVPPSSGRFTGMRTYRLTRQRNDVIAETRDLDGAEPIGIAFSAVNAGGQALPRSAVTNLFLDVRTLEGDLLFQGDVSPNFSPDGGATWGVALVPIGELDPSEVIVYARATHAGGTVRVEGSPAVPADQWRFRVDRIPVSIAATEGGLVRGTTEARASVHIGVPELGRFVDTTAGNDGTFSAQLDLTGMPGGEYEVVVEAIGPWSEDPEKPLTQIFYPGMTDAVPDDERGAATARLRHLPGGVDPSTHRDGLAIDEQAALAFLDANGGVGSTLRTTAWTVRARGGHAAGAQGYLRSLGTRHGAGWRSGEPASAVATGLGVEALTRLQEGARLSPGAFLRWDGGAAPAPGVDASSLEATARLVLGLHATGRLGGLDSWWRGKVSGFLQRAVPTTAQEAFERIAALRALGLDPAVSVPGSDLDAVAYRVLLGAEPPESLAPFQTHGGGFTLRAAGDTAEAYPTALALAAARG